MKTHIAVAVVMRVALGGCRLGPRSYEAQAVVSVDAAGRRASQAEIDSEVAAIQGLVPAFVSADERWQVRAVPNTTLIRISVTTHDPRASADVCNQIAAKFTTLTNGVVARRIVDQAKTPAAPTH
jgi:uncharacterized protein involved in exopolysaccharide biosynthesis